MFRQINNHSINKEKLQEKREINHIQELANKNRFNKNMFKN